MNIKHAALSLLAGGVAALSSGSAMAGFNDVISFSQAGQVSITLDAVSGSYNHVLELAGTQGPIGASPLFYLSTNGIPVLGQSPATIGSTASLGTYTPGSELTFRVTNVEASPRNQAIREQVFTGSSNGLNAQPAYYNSLVEYLSPTSIRVTVEDLFPVDPASLPTDADFKGGADVSFTLNLSPVPEADSSLMALAGLGVLSGAVSRRRRRQG